ncbi:hypothetical protein BJP36_28890 [Moorena producens JHB]|uniref:Uncharacterized protein n=1 Tax=Moorena producens (strain JHB) TaxID=1454205 RepID=A0A1D9G7F9_MOOP1|nr:hypothetical protein [Moorena producens]AOY83340.1 hypothetical protein BJP36_28890 [Moorena producens JHB]
MVSCYAAYPELTLLNQHQRPDITMSIVLVQKKGAERLLATVSIQLSAVSRQFLNKRGKLWPWPVATLREWPRYGTVKSKLGHRVEACATN